MNRPKILINEPLGFPSQAIELLSQLGEVVFNNGNYQRAGIDAVFIRLSTYVGKDYLQSHPKLKWVITPTTGTNHIDEQACQDSNVKLLSLKGHTDFLDEIRATAEHTLALTLALVRKLPLAANSVLRKEWDRYKFKGTELSSKKILVLGYGRLGKQVASLYEAFGCTVYAHDIKTNQVPKKYSCQFPEILKNIDILTIHLDLNEGNIGYFDQEKLNMMHENSILVNTSRGEILDQNALFEILLSGGIKGAALDVLVNESNPFSDWNANWDKLIETGRLVVTPHISGFTYESLEKVEIFMAQQFASNLNNFTTGTATC